MNNTADYLKKENSVVALISLLNVLRLTGKRKRRMDKGFISGTQIWEASRFCHRWVQNIRAE